MASFQPRGISRRPMREVRDTRKPLYMVFILDTSGSMDESVPVQGKDGETRAVKKIQELNEGLSDALNSMRRFEANNVLYKVYYQIIELNSYGKALFPDFVPLSVQSEEICFHAEGVTCLENSLATLKSFLDPKHMPGCNRAVNIILMSDGYPTDTEGYIVGADVYGKVIGGFKAYLDARGLRPNMDLYSIGVGKDACEDMLTTFADKDKFYHVEQMESLAERLDFVTRKSLVKHATRPVTQTVSTSADNSVVSENDSPYEIDTATCLKENCLGCLDTCALSAIQYGQGIVSISTELCVGCGVCASRCPVHAIQIKKDEGCDDLI